MGAGESRGWPNSREGGLGPRAGERYHGREMLNWSGRASELGGRPGPAPFPLPRGYPHVWQPSEMTGPGGPRGPCHSLWRGGACLMAGDCPDPENSPDPIGVPVNPGGGRTPEREGWAPDRLGIPGMEMLLGSRGEPRGPAPFPHP